MTDEPLRGDADDEPGPGAGGSAGGAETPPASGDRPSSVIERIAEGEDHPHFRFVLGLFLAVGVGNGVLLLLQAVLPGSGRVASGLVDAAGLAVTSGDAVAVPVAVVAGALAGVRFRGSARDAATLVGFAAVNGAALLVVVVFAFAFPLSFGTSGTGVVVPVASDPATVLWGLVRLVATVGVVAGLTAYVAADYAD